MTCKLLNSIKVAADRLEAGELMDKILRKSSHGAARDASTGGRPRQNESGDRTGNLTSLSLYDKAS